VLDAGAREAIARVVDERVEVRREDDAASAIERGADDLARRRRLAEAGRALHDDGSRAGSVSVSYAIDERGLIGTQRDHRFVSAVALSRGSREGRTACRERR
jgi:hypothetical protein